MTDDDRLTLDKFRAMGGRPKRVGSCALAYFLGPFRWCEWTDGEGHHAFAMIDVWHWESPRFETVGELRRACESVGVEVAV